MHLNFSIKKQYLITKITGFTLIEILVALVIISTGMLGLAAVQVRSLQDSQLSFERSMATLQSRDLIERMWAGLCILYDSNGAIIANAESSIVSSWKNDHQDINNNALSNWVSTLSPVGGDNVWRLEITWDGWGNRPQKILHHFRLPPPLAENCS